MTSVRVALMLVLVIGALEREGDAWFGLNAERDEQVLQRIQDSRTSDDPMNLFRDIVNDPEYQMNLWEDVMDMSSLKFR